MYKTEVYILGQKYTIKGEKSPEYIQNLAAFVDQKLRKVYEQNSAMPPLRAAILACFYIADELYELRKECEDTKQKLKQLEEKTNEILLLLD
ncbi:MAG: cell division protein ZapA [Thermodesulfovibrio sp.]|nr:cell division protein ZapA [Thermodesulfovibrio sp.]MDW7998084.1 cell division protein ZapA [Thermodesulfovibrio sp.]